jgi:hypothetical protein
MRIQSESVGSPHCSFSIEENGRVFYAAVEFPFPVTAFAELCAHEVKATRHLEQGGALAFASLLSEALRVDHEFMDRDRLSRPLPSARHLQAR